MITYNFSSNDALLVLKKRGTYFSLTVDELLEIKTIINELEQGISLHYTPDLRSNTVNSCGIIDNKYVKLLQSKLE